MNFDVLNNDCWLAIIKYLDLTDQFLLYDSIKGVSYCLHSSMVYVWQHQISCKLTEVNFKQFKESPEMLDIFLASISPKVQKLHLKFVMMDFLKRGQNFTFPSMKILEYSFNGGNLHYGGFEEAIEIMTKIFCPKEIAKYQRLEELTFIYDDILAMKLRQLANYNTNKRHDILVELLRNRSKDIRRITFKDSISQYNMCTLKKPTILGQLTLVEYCGINDENLLKLIANLKYLEQLDFIDYNMKISELLLWQIVLTCPSLKILTLSSVLMNFEYGYIYMEDALDNRSLPLTLHWDNTDANEELIRHHFNHPKLKHSFSQLKSDLFSCNMIQIYLRPSQS
ncbi:uncharacterized protein LOC133841612 isoform X1 [Drosophila sulfurigaster albostrigata]|uniref:uncharacterized protein LOC133841612 isoform X1 n=1 Tax=Drosophila sulfurigaster albostrigata TaxID=89887 RepID=UPI002D21B6DB|nr:uncharacterized protein LOC133841612 isoform X1 [Drosophila sulfurigaster albostrigata]